MMTSDPTASAEPDYRSPETWDHLSAAMTKRFEARPAASPASRGVVDCPPEWRWRPMLHDYDLWLVTKGRGRVCLTNANATYDVTTGTLLVLRPGDTGWAEQDLNDRLTVAYLHIDFIVPGQDALADVPASMLPVRHVPFDDLSLIEALLVRVIRLMESRQFLAEIEARSLLQQALIQIYRQDAANHQVAIPAIDSRIERVLTAIRKAPHERLSLSQAASLACLSDAYFSRLFRQDAGTSFRDYAVQVRLERARYLLEEADMTVGEIAASLGYNDIFLFSRQFKQRYGIAPSHIRGHPPEFNV